MSLRIDTNHSKIDFLNARLLSIFVRRARSQNKEKAKGNRENAIEMRLKYKIKNMIT